MIGSSRLPSPKRKPKLVKGGRLRGRQGERNDHLLKVFRVVKNLMVNSCFRLSAMAVF